METFLWSGWRDEAKKVAGSGTDKAYVRPSKEGYSQVEVDHLFSSIVLPNITYLCLGSLNQS